MVELRFGVWYGVWWLLVCSIGSTGVALEFKAFCLHIWTAIQNIPDKTNPIF